MPSKSKSQQPAKQRTCKRGHVVVGLCLVCAKMRGDKYRKANAVEWNARSCAYNQKHADIIHNNSKRWRQTNPGKVCASVVLRSNRIAQATPQWACVKTIERIYELAATISLTTSIPHEVDHIIPVTNPLVCGLHVPHNLQVIPATENRRKHNRYQHAS